jgi:hypothetical protein
MTKSRLCLWVLAIAAGASFPSAKASAQDAAQPAEAPVVTSAPAPEPEPEPEPAPPQEAAEAPAAEDAAEDVSDHASMAGHMAVGFLGLASVPVGGGFGDVAAPVIGVRHWANARVGLDVGLGFGFQRESSKFLPPVGPRDDGARTYAIGAIGHIGMPIALFHKNHYAFLLIPEADVGVGFVADDPDPETDNDEVRNLGVVVNAGARVGSEIHFGFMGIPQLSLQASVGARARYEFRQSKNLGVDSINREHDLNVGTTVQNSPWNVFIANIAALYYF